MLPWQQRQVYPLSVSFKQLTPIYEKSPSFKVMAFAVLEFWDNELDLRGNRVKLPPVVTGLSVHISKVVSYKQMT